MENYYALVDFHENSQVDLERVLPYLTQLRNCCRSPTSNDLKWTYVIHYILAYCVARAVIRTMIAQGHPKYQEDVDVENDRKLSRLFPTLSLFDNKNQTVNAIWETYYSKGNTLSKQAPEIFLVGGLPWNFAYYTVPKRQTE